MKKNLKTEIKQRLIVAKQIGNNEYYSYRFLLNKNKNLHFIREVGNSLLGDNSHEYKHYAADVLSQLGDARVVPYLINAAKSNINKGFSAPYIWACSKYNCIKYIDFFIQRVVCSDSPDENVAACLAVFMALKPPYDLNKLKKSIVKIISKKTNDAFMELLLAQCCHILSENYFNEADAIFKKN